MIAGHALSPVQSLVLSIKMFALAQLCSFHTLDYLNFTFQRMSRALQRFANFLR